MRIKPNIEATTNLDILENEEVLDKVSNELISQGGDVPVSKTRLVAQQSLIKNGLGIEATAAQLARMSRNARDDNVKLRCLETSFKIHDVLNDGDKEEGGTKIQIIISGESGININNGDLSKMLNPQRS